MAAFFSLSQHVTNGVNFFTTTNRDEATDIGDHQPTDPWNLGVSTSTSTAETIAQPQTREEDALFYKKSPPTPEGLRPRKSIERIRKDILESNQYVHETKFSRHLPDGGEVNPRPEETLRAMSRNSAMLGNQVLKSSSDIKNGLGTLPLQFQRIDKSPIRPTPSFYEQSVEKGTNFFREDFDMDSSMEGSNYSRQSMASSRSQQVAQSPDLSRGGKAKTAVGALLVAMAENSAKPKETNIFEENRCKTLIQENSRYKHILPPRNWMDGHYQEYEYLGNDLIDEDDTIHEDSDHGREFNDVVDDDQSSLHASPSSLKRGIFHTSWIERQQNFHKDSSFTRRILNDDPSSSRLEGTTNLDSSPYDFNSILNDEIPSVRESEPTSAPRLLSLVKDDGRLDLSAISYSHHQKDTESMNTSIEETIHDEEEDYKEIPMYYQALVDNDPTKNITRDDSLILAKVQNQRREKEDLLRSTFERLQDCLDLLKEVYSRSSKENLLFLGLGKTKDADKYHRHLQVLSSDLQAHGTKRQAVLFCMSILQNASSSSSIVGSFPTWVPLPGFRSSLGLKEEPRSPRTIRGGDTSLFSLPTDSANESTPHTSNVSLATTITTVVSPDKYRSGICKQQQQGSCVDPSDENYCHLNLNDIRKTIESLARLLYNLEETCCDLKLKMRATEKAEVIENIHNIYIEFLSVSAFDLRTIIDSFEMEFYEPQIMTRTVSNDQDVTESLSYPLFHSSCEGENFNIQNRGKWSNDTLRMNIFQCDNDDIDDDTRNQSIECGLISPTTNDMMSLISPQSEEDNEAVTNGAYAELVDDEPVDDLRRTVGSFDNGNGEEERESPPSFDEDERDHIISFPATFARRVGAQRSRKSRFWKKRFLALKNRGRQATAE